MESVESCLRGWKRRGLGECDAVLLSADTGCRDVSICVRLNSFPSTRIARQRVVELLGSGVGQEGEEAQWTCHRG